MDQRMIEMRQKFFNMYKHNYQLSNGEYDLAGIIGIYAIWGCELTPDEKAYWNYLQSEADRRRKQMMTK